jgi:hypothetical protein
VAPRNGADLATAETVSEARKVSTDKLPSEPHTQNPQATWSLTYGDTRAPLALVVPDARWPRMYRVHWPDGRVSDLANLARCRDAATTLCERGSPERNWRLFRWKLDLPETPTKPVLARSGARSAA